MYNAYSGNKILVYINTYFLKVRRINISVIPDTATAQAFSYNHPHCRLPPLDLYAAFI